jgi:hypothetical protein
MAKLQKIFYGLIFLIFIYIGFGFLVVPFILKSQLIKNLDENLTQKTDIGKIEFNPLTLKTTIYDFKISDANDVTTISFKEFLVDFSLLRSIKQQNIRFKDIILKEAFVNIIEEKDGTLNLSKLTKPSLNEEPKKEEEKSSLNIDFFVSKLFLDNANIKYSNQNKIPYTLDLKNINYTLYDVGTYKNSLSSSDLKLKLNEHTNISIGGAFKLQPFKAYGKVTIEDLRLKEFLAYKKDMLNFDLDEKTNLNLILNYNLDTTNNVDLTLSTDKFEFNNINLKQNKNPLVNLEKLDIKTFNFDLQKQNISFEDIDLKTLKANMILDKNGINFAKLINKSKEETKDKEPKVEEQKAQTQEETKPWNINLSKIKLNNSDFIFNDKINDSISTSKTFNINLNNLQVVGSDIDLNGLVLENPNLSYIDENNKLSVIAKNANINLDKLSLKNEVLDINSVVLKTANLNFIDEKSKIESKASNIQLRVNKLVNKKDELFIDSIKLFEPNLDFLTSDKTKILAKNLDLEIKKISNTKAGFKIEKTNLNKPNISIVLAKKDSTKEDEKPLLKEQKKPTQNKETTTQTKINVGPVNISNAVFNFEDKNLPLPFKTTVTKLNGKISEFKNTKSSTTNLELKGVVDDYGVAKITGILQPTNIKLLTDINLIFSNIAIKNFTPYSGKFVGREIKTGKLDLDLKYNIEKSNLEAKNNIVITKLELGEKVESPEAVSLPLDIAISLLKDSKGVIDINLPVSGNVDDPQFAIGSIVWKAFVNLITKAVTAPFSLLGAMFNFSEDEIKSVKFAIKEDEITPIQKETLDKIALILKAKKDIAIKISPSFNKEKESEKIGKNRILNIKEYLVKEKSISQKQIILSNEIETSDSSVNLKIEQIKYN